MRGKFQMMFIQYGELPIQKIYHKEGSWKLHRWNLSDLEEPLRCVQGTPN